MRQKGELLIALFDHNLDVLHIVVCGLKCTFHPQPLHRCDSPGIVTRRCGPDYQPKCPLKCNHYSEHPEIKGGEKTLFGATRESGDQPVHPLRVG